MLRLLAYRPGSWCGGESPAVLAMTDLGLTILGNGCFIGDVARCRADARGSVGLQLVRAVRWSLDEARIALMGITAGVRYRH